MCALCEENNSKSSKEIFLYLEIILMKQTAFFTFHTYLVEVNGFAKI